MLVGTEGRKAGEAFGGTVGLQSPALLPLWSPGLASTPAPLPSGACYSWNTESCGSQIRLVQGPGEERQPRARLLVKKLLLNFSCSLGGPAAAGQCTGMREDHRTRLVGKDLRDHRVTQHHLVNQTVAASGTSSPKRDIL